MTIDIGEGGGTRASGGVDDDDDGGVRHRDNCVVITYPAVPIEDIRFSCPCCHFFISLINCANRFHSCIPTLPTSSYLVSTINTKLAVGISLSKKDYFNQKKINNKVGDKNKEWNAKQVFEVDTMGNDIYEGSPVYV